MVFPSTEFLPLDRVADSANMVTLFLIKFRWDDQKRHSIESGIEAEWHSIEIER